MSNVATIPSPQKRSLIATMAEGYHMEPASFAATVRATCMPANSTDEEFAAFLLVAHQHGLNPVTREIYAFPKKGGGIQPIVGIDGWMTLINSHPQSDGLEFVDLFDDKGKLSGITCKLYRKDRNRPTEVTEYMEECKRPTEPWQKWPARMLRHKAAIQCARYAFGFAGIIDPEEAERSSEVITGNVMAPAPQITHRVEPIEVTDNGKPHAAVQEAEDAEVEFDYCDYFERLDLDLKAAKDAGAVERVWLEAKADEMFKDDAENFELAESMKIKRLAVLHPSNGG
jgi:phage recombination protein Bet